METFSFLTSPNQQKPIDLAIQHSTTNQLIYLVNNIHRAFDSTKSLEVRPIFLDIFKAFDKVWHDGLIFKMRQNGVSGRLIKRFHNYLKTTRGSEWFPS